MSPRLLIVETERELRAWLRHHIEILWPDASVEDIEPSRISERAETLSKRSLDLIILGAHFSDGGDDSSTGLEVLRELRRQKDPAPVIVIATGGNELSAVRAMRLGASDYLPRSLASAQRLATVLRLALRTRRRGSGRTRPKATRRRIDGLQLELPQYSILHQLGESSRAVVYLAHSATMGRNVALKISKPETVERAESSQEFAREFAAISAVRHPCVVEIFDYGFHNGMEFIAMEYFPCGDLKTRLQQPLTVTEALEFGQRICGALKVIHSAGLVHRDLKPPNVMLREDGSVVLIDFGLAKSIDSVSHTTIAGVLRGSPYYMSPEQAQGLKLDARSDLYSVGVMLFEMLSGSKPYTGNSAVDVMQQHVHGPRPALPEACGWLEPLLEQFMAREPAERIADADAAYAALAVALAGAEHSAPPLEAVAALP